MLSIDEAIAREREVAEMHRNDIVPKENYHNMPWIDKENELNMRSAEEHEQLAEWLEELVMFRLESCMILMPERLHLVKNIYNKAIDDFVEELKDYFVIPHDVRVIEMKAQQLKERNKNNV